MKKYKNIFLLLIVASTILSAGCTKKESVKSEKETVSANSVAVYIKKVQKRGIRPRIFGTGTLRASKDVTVSSENSGNLINVNYREGQNVSKGTVLASVNPADYILRVNNATAALNRAKADYENIKAEYERKKTLYENEIIPKQQLDNTETKFAVSSSDIAGAEANLALAKRELKKATVISPINGAVKAKFVSTGDYVKEGTPLYEVITVNPLKLIFTVSEENISKINKGQEVSFTVNAFPDEIFKGKVRSVYPNVNEETRNLTIEAFVNNPERKLKPGMFANTNIFTGETKNILTVPAVSILYDDEKAGVFVFKDGIAMYKEVLIGDKYDETTEVTQGLDEKMQVIVSGHRGLQEGVKVHEAR